MELIQDARTAKTYRDEIDILKERVSYSLNNAYEVTFSLFLLAIKECWADFVLNFLKFVCVPVCVCNSLNGKDLHKLQMEEINVGGRGNICVVKTFKTILFATLKNFFLII